MKIWVLLYCLTASTCGVAPECKLLGAFTSKDEATAFGKDFCMDDKECCIRMQAEEVEVLGDPNGI